MIARLLAVLSELESGREDGPILRRINAWIDRDLPERQAEHDARRRLCPNCSQPGIGVEAGVCPTCGFREPAHRERELVKRQLARRYPPASRQMRTPLWRYFAAAVLILSVAAVALSGVLGLWSFFAIVGALAAVGVLIFT